MPIIEIDASKPFYFNPSRVLTLEARSFINSGCLNTTNKPKIGPLGYSWSIITHEQAQSLSNHTLISAGLETNSTLNHTFSWFDLSSQTNAKLKSLVLKSFELKEQAKYLFMVTDNCFVFGVL